MATIIGIFVIAMQAVSICCDIFFGTKITDENLNFLDYNLTINEERLDG
jgi:hypothetical protein